MMNGCCSNHARSASEWVLSRWGSTRLRRSSLRTYSPSRKEVVRLLSNDYQTTYVLHPPRGRVEGEERAFGEGRRDNPRIPSVSALPALARLGSLRDPPKGRVNLSRTTSLWVESSRMDVIRNHVAMSDRLAR
jgi:hypothetical protein